MNAERLIHYYQQIADAPDAVAQLRRFILDLAVRGKLVPQDPNDEPASVLLERIAEKKQNSTKNNRVRQSLDYTGDNIGDNLFSIPRSWKWTRFTDIANFYAGKTPSRNDTTFWNTGDYPWVSIADMYTGQTLYKTKETVSLKARNSIFGRDPEPIGTLIMSFKLTIGKICRLGIPAFHNEAIISIHPYIEDIEPYLFIFLPQFAQQGRTKSAIKGATLNRDTISNILLPLPPLAEQKRIVERVDQLMALCDQLEAARHEREQLRSQFSAATLARLNQPAEDQAAFRADAGFALQHFATLSATPTQIKALRQTILNLAVRGKLVPQDPNDEPASVLLKRIAEEKAAKGQIKRNNQDSIDLDIEPFELPLGWNWIKLGELILHSESGWSPKTENYPRQGEAWGVLKVSAVSWGVFRSWENKQVLPNTEPRLQAQIKHGDFLISRANTAELIARAVIVHEEPYNLMMSDKIVRLTLSDYCDHHFICMLNNNAKFARIHYERNASGVSPSMKNISREVIMNLPIPLPPLAEQKRIVAKVDQLMALCDQLEASLQQAESVQHQLLKAVLQSALEPVEQLEAA
jgi:type I restriction enzyme S subunit